MRGWSVRASPRCRAPLCLLLEVMGLGSVPVARILVEQGIAGKCGSGAQAHRLPDTAASLWWPARTDLRGRCTESKTRAMWVCACPRGKTVMGKKKKKEHQGDVGSVGGGNKWPLGHKEGQHVRLWSFNWNLLFLQLAEFMLDPKGSLMAREWEVPQRWSKG